MKFGYIFIFFCLTLSLQGESQNWKDQDAYVQLSSVVTQIPNLGVSSLVTADTVDMIKNFEITPNKDAVICQIPGLYYISCGLQPATIVRGVSGYMDTWFNVNGVPIPSSNSRQYVDESLRVSQITNNSVAQLNEGDIISTGFSSSNPYIGIIYIQSYLSNEPSVTSYVFSAYKIR